MGFSATDEYWMRAALAQAQAAARQDEVPVGAVLVDARGEKLGDGFNQPISSSDATAHAEVVTIRAACLTAENYRLPDTTLYVTLEPCTMCIGALIHARVARLVYGASEPRSGVCESHLALHEQTFYNHRLQVEGGLLADESAALLRDFFARRR
jgi:tRNA(adenine34) deaminase